MPGIAQTLASLAPLRMRGAEVLVADGGSTDATVAHTLGGCGDCIPQRTRQMNAGAARAWGEILLLLHTDMPQSVLVFAACHA